MSAFLINQRVIYSGEICTIIRPPRKTDLVSRPNTESQQWINVPGYAELYVSMANLQPLPGGQL